MKSKQRGQNLCQSYHLLLMVSKPQLSSVVQLCLTSCSPMDCSMPGFPVHHQLPELAQTHVHRVSDAIQPSCSLSSPSSPAFNLSHHQGLFQWVPHIRWPKFWSFRFSISPFSDYSGLISFGMDWIDHEYMHTWLYPKTATAESLPSRSFIKLTGKIKKKRCGKINVKKKV